MAQMGKYIGVSFMYSFHELQLQSATRGVMPAFTGLRWMQRISRHLGHGDRFRDPLERWVAGTSPRDATRFNSRGMVESLCHHFDYTQCKLYRCSTIDFRLLPSYFDWAQHKLMRLRGLHLRQISPLLSLLLLGIEINFAFKTQFQTRIV